MFKSAFNAQKKKTKKNFFTIKLFSSLLTHWPKGNVRSEKQTDTSERRNSHSAVSLEVKAKLQF